MILGIVDYVVDKDNILPALREGVRLMRPNEIVVFLFPSYLCYGYQGDGNKVGVSQPQDTQLKDYKNYLDKL